MPSVSAPLPISICIVTYRRTSICRKTIDALVPLLTEHDELLVIEQGGSELVEYCRDFDSERIRGYVLEQPSMVRARNYGIQKARGEVILFVDDDVEPSLSLVEGHRSAYRNPEIVGVAGRILSRGTDPDNVPSHPGSNWLETNFEATQAAEVLHGRGCNMSFRRSALLLTGGFDTGHRPPFFFREDSDMSFRVREGGGKIVFVPEAELLHLDEKTGGARSEATSASALRAELQMYRSHFCHYRDNLYFIVKHFHGRERVKWILNAYRDYVGISRWPWRLVAKNLCFAVAFLEAVWKKWTRKQSFFDDEVQSEAAHDASGEIPHGITLSPVER